MGGLILARPPLRFAPWPLSPRSAGWQAARPAPPAAASGATGSGKPTVVIVDSVPRFTAIASLGKYHARVGLNTPNDVGDVMVRALPEDAGYPLRDIRQVIPAGGFPALLTMLPAGQVDAIWLPALQRVPGSMFQYGLTPGAKSAYQIIDMMQPEPGLIRG